MVAPLPTGAVDDAAVPQKRRLDSLAARARRGGLPMQLAFACCHLVMHVGTAVCLMLLLELATETFIKCACHINAMSMLTKLSHPCSLALMRDSRAAAPHSDCR